MLLFSLTLANALVQNCGKAVKQEIASRMFLDALTRLLRAENTHVTVRNRILELIQSWTDLFRSDSSLGFMVDTFNNLKAEGYSFNTSQPKTPVKVLITNNSLVN